MSSVPFFAVGTLLGAASHLFAPLLWKRALRLVVFGWNYAHDRDFQGFRKKCRGGSADRCPKGSLGNRSSAAILK